MSISQDVDRDAYAAFKKSDDFKKIADAKAILRVRKLLTVMEHAHTAEMPGAAYEILNSYEQSNGEIKFVEDRYMDLLKETVK